MAAVVFAALEAMLVQQIFISHLPATASAMDALWCASVRVCRRIARVARRRRRMAAIGVGRHVGILLLTPMMTGNP